jgi:hypothetical protein
VSDEEWFPRDVDLLQALQDSLTEARRKREEEKRRAEDRCGPSDGDYGA